jgi:hypothetical protein
VTVRGTSVSAINAHLRDAWLKVASLTHAPADKLTMCLYELKTQWLGAGTDGHYDIRFAPPTIKALCEDEVIVYYNIEELKVYEDAAFTVELHTLTNFSLAFIVNVIEEKTRAGTPSYRLDMESELPWLLLLRPVSYCVSSGALLPPPLDLQVPQPGGRQDVREAHRRVRRGDLPRADC